MTDRTIKTIEADLDAKRAQLEDGMANMRDKLQPEALLEAGKDAANTHLVPVATAAGAKAANVAKAHPLALALIGAGAAWLMWSNREKPDTKPADDSPLAGTKYEALSRWEDEGGPLPPDEDLALSEADLAEDDGWMAEADSLRDRARGLLAQIDKAAREKLAPAADLAKERAGVLAALTSDVRHVMSQGLEGLTDQAKSAALSAREAAYSARLSAGEAAQKGVTLAKENPLIVAALVGAAGVAVAGALPRNKAESGQVAQWRDKLFAAATAYAAGAIEKQITAFTDSLSKPVGEAKPADEADDPRQAAAVKAGRESSVSRL